MARSKKFDESKLLGVLIPKDMHDWYRDEAKRNYKSISEYILSILHTHKSNKEKIKENEV